MDEDVSVSPCRTQQGIDIQKAGINGDYKDVFYWVVIGVLAALLAKVQIPTQRDENMMGLLLGGIAGAVFCGFVVRLAFHTGILSLGWVSHVSAFVGAALVVLGMRSAAGHHRPNR